MIPLANLTVTEKQVFKLVEQLSAAEKEVLFERLQKEFIAKRWDRLLKQIEERKKIYPITDEEIEKEVECARKEFHKNRC